MEPQWTPAFEEIAGNVSKALQSDSHDYVYGVLRELEAHKQTIHALLESPAPNDAHRAQLKLGTTQFSPEVMSCCRKLTFFFEEYFSNHFIYATL